MAETSFSDSLRALDELVGVLIVARRLAGDLIVEGDADNAGLVAAITQAHALSQYLTRNRARTYG